MTKFVRPIGDLDLHLFGEGTHRRLWELLGPQPLHVDSTGSAIGVRFAVWAPEATAVYVVGDWHGDARVDAGEPMSPIGVSGIWSTIVPRALTGHRYGFEVATSGGDLVASTDPMARQTDSDGVSVVPSVGRHHWNDDGWMLQRCSSRAGDAPLRIHQFDVTASAASGVRSWDEAAAHLVDHVVALGFTHVEVTPSAHGAAVAALTSGSASAPAMPSLYAPSALLGDHDGLRRFVDEFHHEGVGVLAQWTPAEFSCSARGLDRNEVRNAALANALYWIEEFHLDGVRVGGVSASATSDVSSLVLDAAAVVAEEFPDALMIVE